MVWRWSDSNYEVNCATATMKCVLRCGLVRSRFTPPKTIFALQRVADTGDTRFSSIKFLFQILAHPPSAVA